MNYNIISFIWHYLFGTLANDFTVNMYPFSFSYYESKDKVTKVLRNKDLKLGFINKNFNKILNLNNSINCFDTHQNKWRKHHSGLKKKLQDFDRLKDIIDENISSFEQEIKFDAKDKMTEFMNKVWCKYVFDVNDADDINLFSDIKNELDDYLNKYFHNSILVNIPFIGSIYANIVNSINSKKLKNLKHKIRFLNDKANYWNKSGFTFEEVNESQLLLFLVYDFVYRVLIDYTMTHDTLNKILNRAFLYPCRFRSDGFNFNIINLKKAELFFSFWQRSCIGYPIVKIFLDKLSEILNKKERTLEIMQPIRYTYDYNIPMINSSTNVKWKLGKNYIVENISHHKFKGIDKFYDVMDIFSDKLACKYLINEVCKLNNKYKFDLIVSLEARGFLLAGMVFSDLDIPIIPIRKAGKMPGNTLTQEYENKYSSGTLEIKKIDLSKYKSVLVIDDGIASGGSISGALKLLSNNNLSINKVTAYTMLRHTYTDFCDDMKKFVPDINMHHTFDL